MWLHADIKLLPDIVRHRARVNPDKAALIEGSLRVSFRELDASTNRVAHAIARDGAGPDSVVAFVGIAKTQTTSLAVVAPGIAGALLATAAGLAAAIPAVLIYNFAAKQISKQAGKLEDFSAEFIALVSRDMDRRAG